MKISKISKALICIYGIFFWLHICCSFYNPGIFDSEENNLFFKGVYLFMGDTVSK